MQDFDAQAAAFGARIEDELKSGTLNFPTSFDATLRIKKLVDDPDSSLDNIARAVMAEPVLSARLVRIANTIAMNPYGRKIDDVANAVRRVGLSAVRSVAFAVSAEQLAQDHRSRNMRIIASGLWMHSVDVACWAHAIAKDVKTVPADTALFAGMMVDIGQFYLVSRASEFPAMESNIDRFSEFVAIWSDPIGRAILENFGLPDLVLDAYNYEDPYGGAWPPTTLSDVVFTATLACETPNPFDSLLGGRRGRWESLLADPMPVERLDALMKDVREGRQEMLAAISG